MKLRALIGCTFSACALAFIVPFVAFGLPVSDILSLQAQPTNDQVVLSRVDFVAVPVEVEPAFVEVGVPCGMTDMCGQDPCLCGAVDDWGACACNGRTNVSPTFFVSNSSNDVVDCIEVFGTYWLVPKSDGAAHIVIRTELPHYEHADVAMDVIVQPFGLLDALKIAAALVVVFGVLVGIVFGVRTIVRIIKKRDIRNA